MTKKLTKLLFGLLIAAGWTNAFAQALPAESPVQRLKLELVDNVSIYNIDQQQNVYTNTLRVDQPDGNNKLIASMLKEGDNYIIFSRQGDTESEPTDFGRINLNAVKTAPEVFFDGLNFYGDGSYAPSSSIYITSDMLAELSPYWSTSESGQGLVWQTNGCAYIRATDGLTFTVPDGYTDVVLQIDILVGPDASPGNFAFQVNSDGWYIGSDDTQTGYVATEVFPGINSGDVISILGADASQGQLAVSPDIAWIEVQIFPLSYTTTIEVTPTISYKNGEDWESASALGTATTYTPNVEIDFTNLGNITDQFSESTADNSHPDSYSYNAKLDANVSWPESGGSGNFYANADFSNQSITGDGTWVMNGGDIYQVDTQNHLAAILDYWGALLFTMPETFTGSQVTVTVTSCPGELGARDLYVNGEPHTFTSGSTYTWTVDIAANGIIEFRGPSDTYSVGISSIVISSSNRSSLNAPQNSGMEKKNNLHRGKQHQANEPKLYKERPTERISINQMNIQDK
jgi:hypothetical protein